jgi:hypothetical protein
MAFFKQTSSRFVIGRDSVHASDEPHALTRVVGHDENLDHLVKEIRPADYLPSISGGKATWILYATKPLAVLAQQWSEPRYLVNPESSVQTFVDLSAKRQLEFVYWCQADPDQVFESLKNNLPLPDRYER